MTLLSSMARYRGTNGYLSHVASRSVPSVGVLLIDMQERFFTMKSWDKAQQLVNTQLRVLDRASQLGLPLAVITYLTKGDLVEPIRSRVKHLPHVRYFEKYTDNAFNSNPELVDYLREAHVETAFTMGINASFCVLDTAIGANKEKFGVASAEDVIADSPSIKQSPVQYAAWFKHHGTYGESGLEVISRLANRQGRVESYRR